MSNFDENGKRIPPHSEEAERGVLGSALVEPLRVIDVCLRRMKISHASFYIPSHRLLWENLHLMYRKSLPIDLLTVGEFLKQENVLDRLGGYTFLEGLIDDTHTSSHAEYYAGLVRNHELSRRAISEAAEIIDLAHSTDNSQKLIKGAGERFLNLADEVQDEVSNGDVLDDLCAQFEKAADDFQNKRPVKTYGLPIPWFRLNNLMNGLQSGMIFIGGRPSQGKTTIALNITGQLALGNVPVAWINMDMQTKGRLFQRLVCMIAGVSLPKLKGGYARKDQLAKVRDAAERLRRAPVYVLDTENNLDVICAWIRMQVLKYGVKCVAIDYIQQIMTGDFKTDGSNNINARLTLVSARLKKLQGELGIPFLVLTQLSRNADKDDRIPTLSDLRDSGSLEQDAFQVLLTYRNKKWNDYLEHDYHYRAQWIDLAKYQDGETGSVEFQFYAPYFSFHEAPAGCFDGLPNVLPPKVEYGKGAEAHRHIGAESGRQEDGGGIVPELY